VRLRVFSLATFIADAHLRQATFVAPASIYPWQFLRSPLVNSFLTKQVALEKLFRRLLVALITVVVLGGFWLLSQLGPKDVDFRNFDFTVETV
jgi:hypothetical protein